MKRRPRRSLPATLTALGLLAMCALVAIVSIQLIVGERPWVDYRVVTRVRWNELVPVIAGGIAALLGLLLLLAAVLPGRLTVFPLRGDESGIDSGASRRSYRSTLRAAASGVDGVSSAKLKIGRRQVAAVVSTERTVTDGLADAVRSALDQRLAQIGPVEQPTVKVRVKASRSAS
ncbi:hypothetical protein SAMN05421504_1011090 [Amycolatopsis xylanica]|uniref:DUF6286 domain-containing protein n=1 Tax=Amycolatopsis xylanica TaxID=589385 RepID=A0A1H2V352_9PSEU|nr:DUF6286 domain-containing protein [Amycolatopsis xylanica]SDW62743.1 hypothetical protein SAMN05421504_1011090 [Amycolatopsis xylanica]